MDIEEYIKNRHKKYNIDDDSDELKKIKYLKFLITRVLISIILVISIGIYLKMDDKNVLYIEKYFFEESLEFTKINKWYQDKFGELIPTVSDNSVVVFSDEEIKMKEYEVYNDGVKINLSKNQTVGAFMGGIVVFIGEKDNYGNTLIIQGNDGIDYWYGGITNVSVSLYDYIETDTLIGETANDYLYVVLQKDGKYISYEEILS